jgi:hypothetical protein
MMTVSINGYTATLSTTNFTLNVGAIMLSVVMLSAVMPNVVAPD